MFPNSRKAYSGAVMVIAALWMLVLLAFTGFAVSVGQICIAKQRAQDAADAVVCAGSSAWRPYLYTPAQSDPSFDAGTWRRRTDNAVVSAAEALEMTDCAEANEGTSEAFPVEWDNVNAVIIDRTCSYNTGTGEWLVRVNIGAKMKSRSNAFFPGFGDIISAAADSKAIVTARMISWAVDVLEPGKLYDGQRRLYINPTGGTRAPDGLHSIMPPSGLTDPETPWSLWQNRSLTGRQWNYSDTELLLKICNEPNINNRVIVVPIRTKDNPRVIGFSAVEIIRVDLDSGGAPSRIAVYCIGRDDINPNVVASYRDKCWRWTRRLLP